MIKHKSLLGQFFMLIAELYAEDSFILIRNIGLLYYYSISMLNDSPVSFVPNFSSHFTPSRHVKLYYALETKSSCGDTGETNT